MNNFLEKYTKQIMLIAFLPLYIGMAVILVYLFTGMQSGQPEEVQTKYVELRYDPTIFTKIGDYTMWPLREPVSGENELVIEDTSLLFKEGLTNRDIYNITNSVSYYCEMNNVKPLKGEIQETWVDDNKLRHTKIDIGPILVEQIYDAENSLQRTDYIDGDSTMDNFGTLYAAMYAAEKEEFYNMFIGLGYTGELYAVKEYNCCWYLFYKNNGERRYIRVEKDSGDIVDTGTYSDDGTRTSDKS